jgi:general secretion pathway protein M
MNLRDRLAQLDDRERKLLGVLLAVFGAGVLLALPLTIAAIVHSKKSDNEAVREAIDAIYDNRDAIEKAKAAKNSVLERYARPAPPLAAFLANLAGQVGVEIPESQDRQSVPHGKRYSEHLTKIVLRKVGMLKLAKFMEKIEQSGHPVSISQLNIRKRGSEPDSLDVEMLVSAYERKAQEPKAAKAGKAEADGGAEADEAEPSGDDGEP